MAASIRLVFLFVVLAAPWSTQAEERIGCFSFISGDTLLSMKAQDPVGSIEVCVQKCRTLKATYAGIRNGFQCYCGDNHVHTVNGVLLDDSRCTGRCNDQTQRCGGQFSIVSYSVCMRGHYSNNSNDEPNCDASCNCKDNSICMFNGSCPGECEPGWSGAACNIKAFSSTTDVLTLMPNDVTDPERTGAVGVDTNPDDADGLPVIGIAVGVSLAALVLIAVAALIVYFRRRRSDRQSYGGDYETKSIPAKDTSTQAKADLSMEQTECGPTTTSSTAPPMLNYSTVDFSNNGPVHIDCEDISKSENDVVIQGQLEKVEYAVVRKPADTKHANLKENSLYGVYNGDSDEEKLE